MILDGCIHRAGSDWCGQLGVKMCGVFRNDHHRIPRVWPITVWTHRLVAARFTVCEKLTGALMPVLIGAPVSGHWILINGMGNTLADGLKKFCGGHRQVTSLSLLSPPGPGGGRVRIRPRVRVGAGFAPGPSRVTAGSNGPPTVGSPRKQCSPGHPQPSGGATVKAETPNDSESRQRLDCDLSWIPSLGQPRSHEAEDN